VAKADYDPALGLPCTTHCRTATLSWRQRKRWTAAIWRRRGGRRRRDWRGGCGTRSDAAGDLRQPRRSRPSYRGTRARQRRCTRPASPVARPSTHRCRPLPLCWRRRCCSVATTPPCTPFCRRRQLGAVQRTTEYTGRWQQHHQELVRSHASLQRPPPGVLTEAHLGANHCVWWNQSLRNHDKLCV